MRSNPNRGRRSWTVRTVLASALMSAQLLAGLLAGLPASAAAGDDAYGAADARHLLDSYCDRCHNDLRMSGNWSLSMVDPEEVARGENLEAWEKIFRMTRERAMPPPDRDQPTSDERAAFTAWLQTTLDGYAAANPDPGRTTLRRLNRAEYANAVRDLLAIEVDVADSLPADDSGYGFDNIADVLSVSSTLMDRYFAVAGRVSRLAVGQGPATPVLTSHQVPKDGSYDISGWLNANTNNEVDRLEENHYTQRVALTAGPHMIGMSFRKRLMLDETVQTLRNDTDIVPLPTAPPEDLTLDFVVDGARVGSTSVPSYYMSPRFAQKNFPRDVLQIDVEGPFEATGPGDTPSRRRIFTCSPSAGSASTSGEGACAARIVADLARQAWRRPLAEADIEALMNVFAAARQDTDFEGAIATTLQALLVSPSFLFLVEQDPASAPPGTVHPISDTEFAARLSLFLWSSLPDAELLALAERGELRRPGVLPTQIDRMLTDPKARALTHNFAGQWLFLRNLDHHRPDVMAFPDFDVRLRTAMRQETELFFTNLIRDDGSLLEFLDADYSYLNERLAEHYGIGGVQGPALRRVTLPPEAERGGLLGQASLLTLTSYGNHTSVVKRGHWILDSLLAAPPPPPPPDIPALVSEKEGKALNAREQMALHREDPACASCHVKMDPLGLALEKYDAVGARRILDAGRPIDTSTELPDGTPFDGLRGLQAILLERRDQFARAFTEQLLTYALGRGQTARDRPTIRAIASAAAEDDYRIQRVILEIVTSDPFNHRRTPEA
jgi:mono/diheme cytochrome c family protein